MKVTITDDCFNGVDKMDTDIITQQFKEHKYAKLKSTLYTVTVTP